MFATATWQYPKSQQNHSRKTEQNLILQTLGKTSISLISKKKTETWTQSSPNLASSARLGWPIIHHLPGDEWCLGAQGWRDLEDPEPMPQNGMVRFTGKFGAIHGYPNRHSHIPQILGWFFYIFYDSSWGRPETSKRLSWRSPMLRLNLRAPSRDRNTVDRF